MAGAPRGATWLYVQLEFQSTVDPTMAVRLLTRTGLLYQDLLRHGEAAPGALPPVLSVVLYNGRRSRWTVAPELGRAPVPAGEELERYQPALRYSRLPGRRVRPPWLTPGRIPGWPHSAPGQPRRQAAGEDRSGRLMIARVRPGRTLLLALCALCWSAFPVQASDESHANRLFVEAAKLIQAAEEEAGGVRKLELLKRARHKLETIVDSHPTSGLAVKLISGQKIGTVSLAGLDDEIEVAAVHACPQAPTFDCVLSTAEVSGCFRTRRYAEAYCRISRSAIHGEPGVQSTGGHSDRPRR